MSISISGNGGITGATSNYSFDQSVSIGGTLTYEDVTNIDSVGIITARAGVIVGADPADSGSSNPQGINLNTNGYAVIRRSGGLKGLFLGPSGSSSYNVRIGTGGEANFLGQVGIGTDLSTSLAHPNMDDLQVGAHSGNRGITIVSGSSNFGSLCFGDSPDASGTDRYAGFLEYYHLDDSLKIGTASQPRITISGIGSFACGRTGQITMSTGNKSSHVFEQINNNEFALGLHCDNTNKRGLGIYYADTGQGADGDPFLLFENQTNVKFEVRSNGTMRIGNPTGSAGGAAIFNSDAGTASQRGRQIMYAKTGTSGVQEIFQIYTGSTEKLRIRADGNITNANNSYGPLSDVSLKENIVDANSQWEDLKSIRIVNFNFKEELGYDAHKQIGVVAQEVEVVSPGLVSELKNEEGGTPLKSVATSVLYMKAVKALQEAMTRIETLEAKVQALEGS